MPSVTVQYHDGTVRDVYNGDDTLRAIWAWHEAVLEELGAVSDAVVAEMLGHSAWWDDAYAEADSGDDVSLYVEDAAGETVFRLVQ